MKNYCKFIFFLIPTLVFGTEFTFDLPDNDEECFHELITTTNITCVFEFQVVSGGQLDVDVIIEGPNQRHIYKELRKEYDTFKFNVTHPGEHVICFSNQFSTFTHKSIFMSFVAGDENPLFKGSEEHDTVMTFMEATSDEMHDTLSDIILGQTHYRLQEAHGRRFAEELNERVLWWSMSQTILIIAISLSQVLILRNFFSEPKPIRPREPRYGYLR
ncbi:transmembrane emp24 domain-containing protein 7-like [Sitodiplosis mosellana]|uniref:transmembrane emp24 domain-containing protein 7-like n=1 Tax=Sitodiplosis mosellana TaxID=263140 RepID=UPI0024445790|nr:transmembrane emp24 domain-containing protein 7-like [Sitodiplosis mosellana]